MLFKSVEFELGGSRVDRVYPDSIPGTNFINNKIITQDNDYFYIPLPFFIAPSTYNMVRVYVYGIDYGIDDVELYGDVYDGVDDGEYRIVQTCYIPYEGEEHNGRYENCSMRPKCSAFMIYIQNCGAKVVSGVKLSLDDNVYDIVDCMNVGESVFVILGGEGMESCSSKEFSVVVEGGELKVFYYLYNSICYRNGLAGTRV